MTLIPNHVFSSLIMSRSWYCHPQTSAPKQSFRRRQGATSRSTFNIRNSKRPSEGTVPFFFVTYKYHTVLAIGRTGRDRRPHFKSHSHCQCHLIRCVQTTPQSESLSSERGLVQCHRPDQDPDPDRCGTSRYHVRVRKWNRPMPIFATTRHTMGFMDTNSGRVQHTGGVWHMKNRW